MAKSILEKEDRTINQLAGDIRRSLKRQDIKYLEDYKGEKCPVNYVPPLDLLRHSYCEELISEAKEIRERIAEFKHKCQQVGDKMYEVLMAEDEISDSSKGGFRMGMFDKSAYVDFKMDTVEEIDKAMLSKAEAHKEKFVQEMKDKLDGKIAEDEMFILDMMNDAFETSGGSIDPRIRTKLNRYRSRVDNKNFQKFLDYYNEAFDLRHTKRYEKFVERDDQNKEQSIILTYTKVDPKDPEDDE